MSTPAPLQDERRALVVLLSVIFLNIAGFGLVIPLLPFFGKALDAPAWQIAILFSAYSFGQFLGEPFWGRMSDRVGRRPVLMVTIAGGALAYVALAFAPTIWLAFAARFVGGFLSGNISTLQGALADITRPEERASKMGLMGSAFSLGFMIGPAIGGLLAHPELGTLGFQIPLFAAAGFGLASALAVAVFVRESRPEPKSGARAPQIEVLRQALAHPVIARVMIISFITVAGFAGIEATYGLWTEHRFGWGPREIGFAFMGIGVLGAYCQAILTGRLVRRHGEPKVLTAGLVAMWFGMGFQFLSPTWHVAMIGFAFVCFGQSICFPCLTALISQATPPDRQGETLGINMSNMALARIGGPVFAGQLFSLVNPGAAFVVTAILIMPATALALQILRKAPSAA